MDQRKEEEDNLLKEPTDQRSEEERSEEPAGGHSEEPTDERKAAEEERSSDEESVAASSLFVHPCSLLQYLVRACACCLGIQDPFGGGMKPSSAAPAHTNSSQEEGESTDNKTSETGFYVQEVSVTRVWAVRRPAPPGKPREGNGGNGGHHH